MPARRGARSSRTSAISRVPDARCAPPASLPDGLDVARSRYERAQAMANLGDLELDLNSGERVWSTQLYRIFGFDPAAGTPSLEQVLARIHF